MALDKLSKSVYVHIFPHPSFPDSNKGYIVCDEYVVVVDPTYLLNNVRHDLEELRKITNREVRYVINTHYHSDHTYGNCLFDCDIIGHAKCVELMRQERDKQLYSAFEEVEGSEDRKLLEGVKYPTVLFEESYRLDSNPIIEVTHLGGHTPDLSTVFIPEEKILFASDNVFGSPDPSTPTEPEMNARSDLDEWILALKRMLALNAVIVIPGHLGLCNNQAITKLRDYLQLFVANVRGLKKRGYSKEEVRRKPELLGLPKFAEGWFDPKTVEGVVEHYVDLQYDRL